MKTLALAVAAVFLLTTAASFDADAASRNQGQHSQSGKSHMSKAKNKASQMGKSSDRRAKARTTGQRTGQYGGRG
ncbi:hypothetical protein Rvan_2748 [Rhodomicrobium vannielii ATCC 17100]|uniref:Uncharacterized protein n=1 Tax=Rhodomicrobium vannielii (strain ATCC 17100 / DSM 162 / LMG 4299 / NCIMB 10020 / ATH 3.1.1) TaxID=648757 RepID=E3I833_RHOVT|nr:hypothetical protein [Rhodomicrobium vannielii]ADP71959.1 hypothetical protein Rvan_2748 [Rhodomicrobium vannielii ATCC 17100]